MIVVGGDSLIDLIQTERGQNTVSFQGKRGGSCYNTAMAIGRQGVPCGFITPMSTDTLGQFMSEELTNSGVKHLVEAVDAPTSLAVVTLKDGIASYQFYRDRTAERTWTIEGFHAAYPADTTIFHLASLVIAEAWDGDMWVELFEEKFKAGTVTSFDPNIRAMMIHDRTSYFERLHKMLSATVVLKLSDEDLEWICPDIDFDAGVDWILSHTSAAVTVVTRGGEGALVCFNGAKIDVPVGQIKEMGDTVGAGDTFMASLLVGLTQHGLLSAAAIAGARAETMQSIAIRAAKAAAINCERQGCNPPWAAEL